MPPGRLLHQPFSSGSAVVVWFGENKAALSEAGAFERTAALAAMQVEFYSAFFFMDFLCALVLCVSLPNL